MTCSPLRPPSIPGITPQPWTCAFARRRWGRTSINPRREPRKFGSSFQGRYKMAVRQTWQMNAPSGNGGGLILGEPADVKGRRLAGGLPWLLDMDLTNRVRLGDTVAGGRSGISAPVVPYGGFGIVDRTVSGTVTVTVDDAVLRCDTSAAGVTLNLPAAASMIDQVLEILKLSPLNTISIDPSGAETIGGQATLTVRWALSPVRIRSNGTSWDILEKEELAYDFNIEDNP